MSSEAGQLYIFDLASEKLQVTYASHAMPIRSFAWSADSQVRLPSGRSAEHVLIPSHVQLLISASDDKRLTVHDVRYSPSGKPGSGAVATLTGHTSWVLSTDISPDGRLALSGYVLTCRAACRRITPFIITLVLNYHYSGLPTRR